MVVYGVALLAGSRVSVDLKKSRYWCKKDDELGVYLKLVIVYDIMQSTKNEAILLQVHQKRTPSSCRYWGFFSFCMVEHPFRLIAANVYCLTICRYNR